MKNVLLLFFLFFTLNCISQSNNTVKKDTIFTIYDVDKLFYFESCKDVNPEGRDLLFGCFQKTLKNFINKELSTETYSNLECYSGRSMIMLSFVVNEKGEFEDVRLKFRSNYCRKLYDAIKKITKNLPKVIPAMKNEKNVKVKFRTSLMYRF